MRSFLLLFLLQISPMIMADTVHCNGDCPKPTCSEIENFALVNLDLKSRAYFDRFHSMDSSNSVSSKGQAMISEMAKELKEIGEDRKNFGIPCLKSYCAKKENKYFTKALSSELFIDGANPACDFSGDNVSSPLTMTNFSLRSSSGKIADIMFSANGPLYSLNQAVLTKTCSDGAGGTFKNKIVTSTNGISLIPFEGTTQVKNTPVGAQLVKKKKSIPYFRTLQNGNLQVSYGDGFESEINLSNNTIVRENILTEPCKGSIFKNPAKGTSRVVLPVQSLNTRGLKAFDTNNYRTIEAENNKLTW